VRESTITVLATLLLIGCGSAGGVVMPSATSPTADDNCIAQSLHLRRSYNEDSRIVESVRKGIE
jgi:hypothetical protein